MRDEAELDARARWRRDDDRREQPDLETLVIDPATAERLIPRIPRDVVAIAESGVKTRDDVERYAAAGADAVLVGSSISSAPDPAAATRALADVPRSARAR